MTESTGTSSPPSTTPADESFILQCEADYTIAEVTTVAYQPSSNKSFTHLLGIVELLPKGIEANPNIGRPPDKDGYPRRLKISDRAGTLYVQRWHQTPRKAIHWYRSCLSGTMAVPGRSRKGVPSDNIVSLPELGEDPPWPNTVVEQVPFWDDEGINFWGKRPGGARWHRLLPTTPVEVTRDWSLEDWEKARQLLQKEIHIDLFSRSVLLGSCHLLLPNPVFRSSSLRTTNNDTVLQLDLIPYPGQSLVGLELIIWNQRPWGVSSVMSRPITSPRTSAPIPEGIEETAHAVICPKRGLLLKTKESGFIGAVNFEMNIQTEQRRIQVPPRSKKGEAETYHVGVIDSPVTILAGTPRDPKVLGRLAQDEDTVRANSIWNQLRVQWFDKDANAGRQAIRDIIGSARKRVDMLDPYFGANDLMSFAVATSVRGLPVRILTSSDYCQTLDSEHQIESGELLMRTLHSIRAQDPQLSIDIKVMPGKKSPIHDRFLIVDGTTWVLGASLNEFGDRGTLLIRLPPPPRGSGPRSEAISIPDDVFNKRWLDPVNHAEPIEEFVAGRKARRQHRSWQDRVRETMNLCLRTYRDVQELWRA
jgi:hypothetical protein